jgi:hypothetical protein
MSQNGCQNGSVVILLLPQEAFLQQKTGLFKNFNLARILQIIHLEK